MHEARFWQDYVWDDPEQQLERMHRPAPGRLPATAQITPARVWRDTATEGPLAPAARNQLARAAAEPGRPLPAALADSLGAALGTDVSHTHVHTGTAAAAAAKSLRANAFTVGSDIFFAEQRYQPETIEGRRLIAHEVAHVVQQGEVTPRVQTQLEVSSPDEPLEQQADAFAAAFVSGEPFPFVSVDRSTSAAVHRQPESAPSADKEADDDKDKDEDKAWAQQVRQTIRELETFAEVTTDILTANADTAIGTFQALVSTLAELETRYFSAVEQVAKGIARATAVELANRAAFNMALNIAAAAAAPVLMAHVSEVTAVVGQLQSAWNMVDGQSAAGKKAVAAVDSNPLGQMGSSPVDWQALVNQVLQSYQSTVQQNAALSGIRAACVEYERYLSGIIEGQDGFGRDSDEGRAIELAVASAATSMSFMAMGDGGNLPTMAQDLAAQFATVDEQWQGNRLHQNIAIRWMAGLPAGASVDEIDQAEKYLVSIGLFGAGDTRLQYDHGSYMHDADEVIIKMRAEIEAAAMALVGQQATWMGGTAYGGGAFGGSIRTQGGHHFHAGGSGLSEAGGRSVLITGYQLLPTPAMISDSSYPADAKNLMLDDLTFTVQPIAGTEDNALVPSGPTIGPPGAL